MEAADLDVSLGVSSCLLLDVQTVFLRAADNLLFEAERTDENENFPVDCCDKTRVEND